MSNTPIHDVLSNEKTLQTQIHLQFNEIDKAKSGKIDTKDIESLIQKFATQSKIPVANKVDIDLAKKPFEKNPKENKVTAVEVVTIVKESYKTLLASEEHKNKAEEKKHEESKEEKVAPLNTEDKARISAFLGNEKELQATLKIIFDQVDEKEKKKEGFVFAKQLSDCFKLVTAQLKLSQYPTEAFDSATSHWKATPEAKITLDQFVGAVKKAFTSTKTDTNKSVAFLTQQPEEDEKKPPTEADIRKKLAETYQKYIDETGLAMSFKIIFAEILSKKIPEEQVFAYTVMRLRQIGNDISFIQNSKRTKKI